MVKEDSEFDKLSNEKNKETTLRKGVTDVKRIQTLLDHKRRLH